jgi:hypothetical protein
MTKQHEPTTNDVEESEPPTFVTDYDANGEARDIPVTPPSEEQPQGEMGEPRELEMHDGKIVREHRVAFGGRVDVSLGWPNERAFWDDLRVGKTGQLVVNYEVGDDTYRKMTDEGTVIGLRRVRALKVFSIHFAPAETELDGLPLFDNLNESEEEPDPGECFCAHLPGAHRNDVDEEGVAQLYECLVCNCTKFDALNTLMRKSVLDEALAEAGVS